MTMPAGTGEWVWTPQIVLAMLPSLLLPVLVVVLVVWFSRASRPPRPVGEGWQHRRPLRPPVPHPRTRTSIHRPSAVGTTLVRVLFTTFGLAFLSYSVRWYDGEGPGLWLPLAFAGTACWIFWVATIPLVRDVLDAQRKETVVGTVVDRRRKTVETTSGGDGVCEVTLYSTIVRDDDGVEREYRVDEELWKRAGRAARVRLVVATRSGYVDHSDVAPSAIDPTLPAA